MEAWANDTDAGGNRTGPATTQSLLFIKTHKTGSSSLSRLLFRVLCEHPTAVDRRCFVPPRASPGKIWDLRKAADVRRVRAAPRGPPPYDVWV